MAGLTKSLRFILLVTVMLTILLPKTTNVASKKIPISINKARLQVIKDALFSMMLKRKGTLMTHRDMENLFLEPILEKYRTSKFYRSFVIAFQHGVLPRLNHGEGFFCRYRPRDKYNKTLTWHFLKRLTLKAYDDIHKYSYTYNFCDYRLGLYCIPDPVKPGASLGTCRCPHNSSMQVVDSSKPSDKRCLLPENSTCSLIDMDHGNDLSHSALANNMHQLIFNLERPIGCVEGTQCRFKQADLNRPRCYKNDKLPFYPPPATSPSNVTTWTLKLGANCSVGLYADSGTCEVNNYRKYGPLPGLVCYNYGPSHRDKVTSTGPVIRHEGFTEGFCAHEYGIYGLADGVTGLNGYLNFQPLFIPYVNPRTIPLRGDKLLNYYLRFLHQVLFKLVSGGVQHERKNEPCSPTNTREYADIFWSYYATLNDTPTNPGDEFVDNANQRRLEDNLQKMINLAADPVNKVCMVYKYYRYQNGWKYFGPFYCRNISLDPHDGTCEYGFVGSIYNITQQYQYANRLKDFHVHISNIQREELREEIDYREQMLLDHPETECTPGKDLPQSLTVQQRHAHEATLEGGYCPFGFICYADYGDHTKDVYVDVNLSNCSLKPATKLTLNFICHESGDWVSYGQTCEENQLNRMIDNQMNTTGDPANILDRNMKCHYKEERIIRAWIRDGISKNRNKYLLLATLDNMNFTGGKLCDASKLLECKPNNLCGCVEDTAPRKFPTIDGVQGDLCFLTKGPCSRRDLSQLVPLTDREKANVTINYGKVSGDFCGKDFHICVEYDKEREICKPPHNTKGLELAALDAKGTPRNCLQKGWGTLTVLTVVVNGMYFSIFSN